MTSHICKLSKVEAARRAAEVGVFFTAGIFATLEIFGDLWRSLDHPKWFVLASFGSFNSQDPCDPTGGQSSCRCCRNCGEELSFDLRIDRRHVCHFLPVSQVGTWMYLGEYWIEWWIWLNMIEYAFSSQRVVEAALAAGDFVPMPRAPPSEDDLHCHWK